MRTSFMSLVALALVQASVSADLIEVDHEQMLKDKLADFGNKSESSNFVQYTHELGTPANHSSLDDECHGLDHLCSHKGKPVILQAGHHARAVSNQPIFGILTQPIPDEWRKDLEFGASSFLESSHVDFLQAAGARVVHLDYNMSPKALKKELEKLNGLYIPGDTRINLEDQDFLNSVLTAINWAADHNDQEDHKKHFPVVGVSYGYLAMLYSQIQNYDFFTPLRDDQVGESLQMNLNLMPKDTFTYDEVTGENLERLLDQISFYNEVDTGITLQQFVTTQQLRQFVPVASYDQGSKFDSRKEEIVSMVEGTFYPFFGFAYRIDKKQYGFHAMNGEGQAKVDHSRLSIEHTQHVANLIVDESRLSGNRFEYTEEETQRLLSNVVPETYVLPSPHGYTRDKGYGDFYRTELYVF